MKSLALVWLIIFALIIVSVLTKKIPFWVPVLVYAVLVSLRAKEVFGNYSDLEKKNKRDEKLQIDQKAEEMAERGMTFSGARVQEEKRINEDFDFERRKAKRRLRVNLGETFFLK